MVHRRTNKEIKKIAASCQIVVDTLIMLKSHIVEGVRISDLDKLAESFIRSRGARPAFKGYMGFQHCVYLLIVQSFMVSPAMTHCMRERL